MSDHGRIQIHLKDLLKNSEYSRNKFSQRAEMQRTQLNKYLNNTITRFDADVLARICYVLDCKIEDILEYIPPEKHDRQNEKE